MGLFDTINLKCRCGKFIRSQTKVLGDNNLREINIGDDISWMSAAFEGYYKVKEACPNCGVQNILEIREGILKSVVKDKNKLLLLELNPEDVVIEGAFGYYENRMQFEGLDCPEMCAELIKPSCEEKNIT